MHFQARENFSRQKMQQKPRELSIQPNRPDLSETGANGIEISLESYKKKIRKLFTKFPKSRNSQKKINCTVNLITVKNCQFKALGAALFSGNKMVLHSSLEFSTYANRTFGKIEIAATVRTGLTFCQLLLFFSVATKLKSLFA